MSRTVARIDAAGTLRDREGRLMTGSAARRVAVAGIETAGLLRDRKVV